LIKDFGAATSPVWGGADWQVPVGGFPRLVFFDGKNKLAGGWPSFVQRDSTSKWASMWYTVEILIRAINALPELPLGFSPIDSEKHELKALVEVDGKIKDVAVRQGYMFDISLGGLKQAQSAFKVLSEKGCGVPNTIGNYLDKLVVPNLKKGETLPVPVSMHMILWCFVFKSGKVYDKLHRIIFENAPELIYPSLVTIAEPDKLGFQYKDYKYCEKIIVIEGGWPAQDLFANRKSSMEEAFHKSCKMIAELKEKQECRELAAVPAQNWEQRAEAAEEEVADLTERLRLRSEQYDELKREKEAAEAEAVRSENARRKAAEATQLLHVQTLQQIDGMREDIVRLQEQQLQANQPPASSEAAGSAAQPAAASAEETNKRMRESDPHGDASARAVRARCEDMNESDSDE